MAGQGHQVHHTHEVFLQSNGQLDELRGELEVLANALRRVLVSGSWESLQETMAMAVQSSVPREAGADRRQTQHQAQVSEGKGHTSMAFSGLAPMRSNLLMNANRGTP